MEIISSLEGASVFGAYTYERVVRLPAENREQLLDFELALWGQAQGSGLPSPGPSGTPRDIRVYFDSEDITAAVLSILKAGLDQMNQDDLGRQYLAGMQRFLSMEAQLGQSSASSDLVQAANRAQALSATRPLSSLLDRLGSRGLGAFHNLHIFNFLFTEIAAPLVSLKAALRKHRENGGNEIVLGSRAHTLVLSAGPCRLFATGAWQPPGVDLIGGTLCYRITGRYHDPLEDMLRALQQNISARLDEISRQIGSSGIIVRQLLPAIEQRLGSVEADLNTANAAINGQGQQLSSLTQSVQDLRTAVQHL